MGVPEFFSGAYGSKNARHYKEYRDLLIRRYRWAAGGRGRGWGG
jgi:hypothetical protein